MLLCHQNYKKKLPEKIGLLLQMVPFFYYNSFHLNTIPSFNMIHFHFLSKRFPFYIYVISVQLLSSKTAVLVFSSP
jgi:hypothetical protein